MRQKVFLLLGFVVVVVILIGLNALSYTQKETVPDSELNPNRSTYNSGVTGTRALFELLNSSGRRAVRWQQPPSELRASTKNKPSTFVIVGATRREIEDAEAKQILDWVSDGGKLVIIDRKPQSALLQTTSDWTVQLLNGKSRFLSIDPSDQNAMTKSVNAMRPVQPTNFTTGISAIQPSVMASEILISYAGAASKSEITVAGTPLKTPVPAPTFSMATPKPAPTLRLATPTPIPPPPAIDKTPTPSVKATPRNDEDEETLQAPPIAIKTPNGSGSGIGSGPIVRATPAPTPGIQQNAPVVHVGGGGSNLLVDVPYGAGRVVVLSDPYIVSNGGINLVDNAQLAINVVNANGGIIAFDEFHQGFGANENRVLEFFAGTPLVPVAIQFALLIGLVLYSQSRRFARAVPEPEPNRLSKLEYVSAMAELQQRTKGYDLAIENIFGDFRRRVARLVGVDAQRVRPRDLALLITERLPDENAADIEVLIGRAIDIMQGDKTDKKEVLRMAARIRELEVKLGLSRRKRDSRTN